MDGQMEEGRGARVEPAADRGLESTNRIDTAAGATALGQHGGQTVREKWDQTGGGEVVATPEHGRPLPSWVKALKPYARREAALEAAICELCGAPMAAEHQHLIEPPTRKLLCCCRTCAILFSGGSSQRYRLVPNDPPVLLDPPLSDPAWDSVGIPVGIAMIFRAGDSAIALYPSPAGATESTLSPDAWRELVEQTPRMGQLQPDVQALLVNRLGTTNEAYVVAIDMGFKLVGLVRVHWRGISGQAEVWRELAHFFDELRDQARAHAARPVRHAS
jgi:hypothetical protein